MKKFGFFLFAVLGLIACGDDNNDPTPEQHVTCSISAPAEGATVNIAEKMTIKGEATIDFGEISNVTLKVGGKAISEVTAVPFSYDYTFEANQTEGALKIELTVKGDQGTMATSEVNITLTKPEPTPEPGEGEMVDSRDNHVYKTVEIGEQTWMAENLAYLPKVNKPAAAATCEGEPLYFVYDYDGEDVNAAKNTETYKTYGVLYNWYAAMNKENEEDKNLNKATPKNDFSELNSFMSLSEALSRNNKVEENKANKEKVKDNTITSNNIEKEIKLQSIENKKNEFFIDGVVDVSKSFSFDELNSLNEKNDKKAELNQISEENIKSENRFSITDFRVVGSILNTYIVLEKNEAMYLLDQHAAHEKVLYEEYMKKFKNHKIDMQMLLDPIVMEFSNVDMMKIENNMDLFLNFGFEIELFGNNHIMVRGVPTIFGTPESEKFILQIIDNMEDLSSSYDLKGDKFASMACRAAIKANDKIHIIEMKKLLLQMEKCENPFTCPHGRPTIVEISKKEIEKMFKRIM